VTTFIRYIGVGAYSFAANIAITAGLHEGLGIDERVAFAVALATVFCTNFFLARHFIFAAADGDVSGQLGRFVLTALSFRVIEWIGFYALTTWLDVAYLIAAPTTLVASTLGKYVFYRFFVFPPSERVP